MFELPSSPAESQVSIRPSIFLEYGLDGTAGDDAACEVCERGMRFCARWQFEVGTLLNIAFTFEQPGEERVEAEGVVVECSPSGPRNYRTTLAFVDPPRGLRSQLGKVSARLVSARQPGQA